MSPSYEPFAYGFVTATCTGATYTLAKSKRCIYVNQQRTTWFKARAECVRLGGDLIMLDSAEFHDEVIQVLKGYGTGSSYKYWVGLQGRSWQWPSGMAQHSFIVLLNVHISKDDPQTNGTVSYDYPGWALHYSRNLHVTIWIKE